MGGPSQGFKSLAWLSPNSHPALEQPLIEAKGFRFGEAQTWKIGVGGIDDVIRFGRDDFRGNLQHRGAAGSLESHPGRSELRHQSRPPRFSTFALRRTGTLSLR